MSSLRSKKLRDLRLVLRMTQPLFASVAGIALSTVQNYESGHNEVGLAVLEKVIRCQSFEKFTLWLIGDKPITSQQVKPSLPCQSKEQAAIHSENANSFAERAKLIRMSEGLTQTEFSQLTGISHGMISRYESGRNGIGRKVIDRLIKHPRLEKYAFWLFTGKIDTSEQITPAELHPVSLLPSSVDLPSPVSNPDDGFLDVDRAIENTSISHTKQLTDIPQEIHVSSLRSKKLRDLRLVLRMTQPLFASVAGIALSTVQNYESGPNEVGLAVLEKVIRCQSFEKFTLWLISDKPITSQQVRPSLPHSENANSFSERATLIRMSEGLTQTEFSRLTGISHGVISKYENGRNGIGLKIIDKLIKHPRLEKYAFWLFTGKIDTSEQITPAELHPVSLLPSSVDLSSPVSNPDDWFSDIDRAIESVPMSRTRQQTAKIIARLSDDELKEILDKIEEYRRNKSPDQYDSTPDSKNRDVG